MSETRNYPGGGSMSVEEIEHELGSLRADGEGEPGLRASVLNLVVVTDDDSAGWVSEEVAKLAGRYPSRAILLISDPDDPEPGLDVGLSVFCDARGGQGSRVCAEQITVHAGGTTAGHLESIAGPLLIPDLPVFLLYPHGFDPESPELAGMARISDRVIVDSAAAEYSGGCLRAVAGMLQEEDAPAFGDLQWVALSPWRSLLANLFEPPGRAEMLREVERVELRHAPDGLCRAMLLVGWLADSLGWTARRATEEEGGRELRFERPDGEEVVVAISESSPPEEDLRRIRLYAGDWSFQVSRHREQTDARTTVMHGDELVGERTVHLGTLDLGVLVGEELRYRGRDTAYEGALHKAVEVLDL
jgi:hypothetical protein